MRSLKAKLGQKGKEASATPVYIHYDYFAVTKEQAIEAACRSGKIPLNAVFALFPELPKHENWESIVKREYAERERQRVEHQQLAGQGKQGDS